MWLKLAIVVVGLLQLSGKASLYFQFTLISTGIHVMSYDADDHMCL